MKRTPRIQIAPVALAALIACGGGEQADAGMSETAPEAAPAEPAVSVRIVEPAEGAEVGPDVRVVLETTGIEIRPISPPVPGTGHHHLFLDTDLTPPGQVIPSENPNIVHKGDGSTEHTFEGLAPGTHRIIALVADPAHIPLDPPVADTVTFTVAN